MPESPEQGPVPVLVFGLSGQVGDALRARLDELPGPVVALSRDPHPDAPGLSWVSGRLQVMPPLPCNITTVISLGPLDAFAQWMMQSPSLPLRRVVALGSLGVDDKADSGDPAERDVARRLAEAERHLFEICSRSSIALTLLRPTLLYGNGRDQTVSRLAAFGSRWGWLPLPADAFGLRQPVHVEDVADAVLRCLGEPRSFGQAFDLPGGETLTFAAMTRRIGDVRGARVAPLPTWLFRGALGLASKLARGPLDGGWLSRLVRDQVADAAPASRAFGYRPRPFTP